MTDSPNPRTLVGRWLRIVGTAVVCLSILAGAGAAIVVINRTEPTAQRIEATRKSAALVETLVVQRGTYRPRLKALGTVEPARSIQLSPRISGQIIEASPSFVPGGTVREGELLLQLDPADFENALAIREGELEQAQASLEIERGRQILAQKELALLEGTIDETNRPLVLRTPQIESIRAEVKGAEAAVQRARLDLERTRITAPFDAQILACSVNVGSQVSPGDELAQLVGIDEYWVMATTPVQHLRWVRFADVDGEGAAVALLNPGAWPPGSARRATVSRLIGTLDEQSRLARILITVSDPLAREIDAPALILDTLLETYIEGKPIEDVVRLERDYVRNRDTVWVLQDDQLAIRSVDVVYRDAEFAYLRAGLNDGDEVVTTTLATVAEGVGLRRVDARATEPSAAPEEAPD